MNIDSIAGAVEIIDGFPRADWAIIAENVDAAVKQHTGGRAGPVTDREIITSAVETQRQWMRMMHRQLGGEYRVFDYQRVMFLTEQHERDANQLAEFIEHGQMIIEDCLEAAAAKKHFGKLLVLGFTDEDDYNDYIRHYYPDRYHLLPVATHVRGAAWGETNQGREPRALAGSQLVINNPARRDLRALARELSQLELEHLSLPAWAEVGVAQVLLRMVVDEPPLKLNPASWGQHQSYWSYHGLEDFWKGEWIDRPGEETRLSIELAELLIRSMNKADESRFNYFLLNADRADAGRAAAEKWLGHSLNHFAADVLGEGPWSQTGSP